MSGRWWAIAALAPALLLAGCGSSEGAAETTRAAVPETVAIGPIPEPLSESPSIAPPPATDGAATVTTTSPPVEPIVGPIGDLVRGNRVLLIGDGVLASIAPRFDGIGCDVLPGFGWVVEIAAEPGRFVDFGAEVLDARFDPERGDDWDAVVVMLGHQSDGSVEVEVEARELESLVERVAPRPVLLLTVSDVDGSRADFNDVIRSMPQRHPNVLVFDWEERTAEDPDELLDGGSTPTEEGSGRLVLFMAAELGEAPGGAEGECLEPVFTDDSAIVL